MVLWRGRGCAGAGDRAWPVNDELLGLAAQGALLWQEAASLGLLSKQCLRPHSTLPPSLTGPSGAPNLLQALLLWAPAQIILIFYMLFIFGIFNGRLRMSGNASMAMLRGRQCRWQPGLCCGRPSRRPRGTHCIECLPCNRT